MAGATVINGCWIVASSSSGNIVLQELGFCGTRQSRYSGNSYLMNFRAKHCSGHQAKYCYHSG